MIGAVVGGELVRLAVESEAALGDAVAVAADDGPEVRRLREIPGERGVAEHDVVEVALAVRRMQPDDGGAVRHGADLDVVRVRQGEQLHGLAIRRGAEGRAGDAGAHQRRTRVPAGRGSEYDRERGGGDSACREAHGAILPSRARVSESGGRRVLLDTGRV